MGVQLDQRLKDIQQQASEMTIDLAGFAAYDAMRVLLQNWDDAVACNDPKFKESDMLGDLDQTLAVLINFRQRLNDAMQMGADIRDLDVHPDEVPSTARVLSALKQV